MPKKFSSDAYEKKFPKQGIAQHLMMGFFCWFKWHYDDKDGIVKVGAIQFSV